MKRYLSFFFLCLFLPLFAEQQIPTEGLVPLRPTTEAQFAFLCLDNAQIATPKKLKQALSQWFSLKKPTEIRHFTFDPNTPSFSWIIGRSRFFASLEPAPIPKDDIRYSANNSLHWPTAEKEILKHQAHYIVTCVSKHRKPWHAALDLSRAIAALTETHNTTGIYWGDASIVHPPASFLQQARYQIDSNKPIPTTLWIGLLFESTPQGTWNIFTKGLETLGHREIEIHSSQLQLLQLFTFLHSLKRDVVAEKFFLKEGQQLVDKKGNHWQISAAKSIIGREKPIWLLTQIKKK